MALLFFCRSGRGDANLEEFSNEVALPKVPLPPLGSEVLAEVVRRKGATAGSLNGWGCREMKVPPVPWFDGLAKILTTVGDKGV